MTMTEYIQALNSLTQSGPINCADGDSVLALLYEAYSGTHPLEDTAIKQAFSDLYQAMSGMALPEMDQILYPICTLCRTHERSGFEAGVKLGVRLAQEIFD